MQEIKLNELVSVTLREDPEMDGPGYLIVDGHEVPYITVSRSDDIGEDGHPKLWLSLDGRFGHQYSREELGALGWFLANAMAVSAGFTAHGPNSAIRNPHGNSIVGVQTEHGETVTEDDTQD